ARGRARRRREPTGAVALDQILDDRTRLEHRDVAVLDGRDLTERMRAEMRRVARRLAGQRDPTHFVRDVELFQEPDDADRTGLRGMMDDDHASDPCPGSTSESSSARSSGSSTA